MTKKIDTIKHKDKRPNIPTQELRGFVSDEEKKPKKNLYPRDPSLDPQLVWKGKDEQDQKDLEVLVVPIYIQEKIHPQSIIDDVRRRSMREVGEQADFFADFGNADKMHSCSRLLAFKQADNSISVSRLSA